MLNYLEKWLSPLEQKKGLAVLIALCCGFMGSILLLLSGFATVRQLLLGLVIVGGVVPIIVIISIIVNMMESKWPHPAYSRIIGAGIGMLWPSLIMLLATLYIAKSHTMFFEFISLATVISSGVFNLCVNNYKGVESSIAANFPGLKDMPDTAVDKKESKKLSINKKKSR